MRIKCQKIFNQKSKIRSTSLILTAIFLWVTLPHFVQFGADAQTHTTLPDLVANLLPPSSNSGSGAATYDVRQINGATVRELIVNVQGVNVPTGTVVSVFLNDNQIGSMTIDSMRRGRLVLSTTSPTPVNVPTVVNGDAISVRNGNSTLLAGVFRPPTTPTTTPTPGPTAPNQIRLFASLTGSAIDGIVPRGIGIYHALDGRRKLEVFVSSVNLPNGTVLFVNLDNVTIGTITLQNRAGSLRLTTDNGGTVPVVNVGSTLTVNNANATVVSGTFTNSPTPPVPPATPTPPGTPPTTPTPPNTPSPMARSFVAKLRGRSVVPPVITEGRGLGVVSLNAAQTTINVHLNYFNLSSNATEITINGPALPTENAPVIFTLNNPGGTSGRITAQTFSVSEEQVAQLRNGLLYFLIKTANYPEGEIRGQIRATNRRGDFDGDGFADVSVLRANSSGYNWYILNSADSTLSIRTFGQAGDIKVQGDYDGDGAIDLAVFTPSTGIWTISRSATGTIFSYQFGRSGDVPMTGDYDGDGINDLTVFRPSEGVWYILRSGDNGYTIMRWGLNGDKPVAGDYDGDGVNDLTVYRPSTGIWYIFRSSTQTMLALRWGLSNDQPVSGDFDGDGTTDVGIFRPSAGVWYIFNPVNGNIIIRQFGLSGDIPVPAEYDDDEITDLAVFRPNEGNWYIWQSSANSLAVCRFGLPTDIPSHTIYAR
jgi:hypothetical protein